MRSFLYDRIRRAPHHKATLTLSVVSAMLVLGGMSWAYGVLYDSSRPLIIHFTNFDGITGYGKIEDLIAVGIFGLVAVLINSYLAWEFDDRAPVFARVLMTGTVFIALLLFIGFAAIINVN
ncbi:MAG: hypothetical protein Q7S28_03095 [bacterium]|nr:hypothetical protein [bacterium]